MNNLEINDRIAKLCGWTVRDETLGWKKLYISPTGRIESDPPFYTNSLDLCREFESKLTAPEQTEYAVQLRYIVTRNVERDHEPLNPDTLRIPDGRYYCATPLERCEAFLRLNNQWE